MTPLSAHASLHESTVRNAEQHAGRHRPAVPTPRARVHSAAWSTAMRLAGGNTSRIEIVSESVVIVR